MTDELKAARRHHGGVGGAHEGLELFKFRIIVDAGIVHRPAAYGLGEPSYRAFGVQLGVAFLPGKEIKYAVHAYLSSK